MKKSHNKDFIGNFEINSELILAIWFQLNFKILTLDSHGCCFYTVYETSMKLF
jgi:hypothetical protein